MLAKKSYTIATTLTKPFSEVHRTLHALGFRIVRNRPQPSYRIVFRTFADSQGYPLYLPFHTSDNGQMEVMFHQAYFKKELEVPECVRVAAECKLVEAASYIEQCGERKAKSLNTAKNGTMAQDEEEMRRLGKEMQQMKTNSEVLESGWVPDPAQ